MILRNGGSVAILDMNAELGQKAAAELGSGARFFGCDVTSSGSVKEAVDGTVAWVKETGRPLGGVVPAAGIANPGTVSLLFYRPGDVRMQESLPKYEEWRLGDAEGCWDGGKGD